MPFKSMYSAMVRQLQGLGASDDHLMAYTSLWNSAMHALGPIPCPHCFHERLGVQRLRPTDQDTTTQTVQCDHCHRRYTFPRNGACSV